MNGFISVGFLDDVDHSRDYHNSLELAQAVVKRNSDLRLDGALVSTMSVVRQGLCFLD